MLKLILYPLLALAVLVSICMHTKPAPERHVQEVSAHVAGTLRNYSKDGVSIPGSVIARIEGDSLVHRILEKTVTVDDYALMSLCKVVTPSDEYILSVGILGRIIILPKEEIAEMIFIRLRENKIID